MVNNLKKTNKKGFTLVELVIVIAILAILAAIAIPTVTNVIGTANQNVDKANAQTVELAIKSAYAEAVAGTWKTYPDSTTAVDAATLKVKDALIHEGISTLPEKKVTGTDYRAVNGKVSLSKNTDDGKTFDGDIYVKVVVENTTTGTGALAN